MRFGNLKPPAVALRRTAARGLGLFGLAALAYAAGRIGVSPRATAVPPTPPASAQAATPTTDFSRRAVAYIYGNIMISREDLGEYLIAREGADRLQYLVNKRIIEHACKEKGVVVTTAEIEQALAEDLKSLNVNIKDFEDKILKTTYHKSLFEWKEDVIRTKLAMRKLCAGEVQVAADDLQKAFQAYYGEKVKCRILLYPKEQEQLVMKMYDKIRGSEEEFASAARHQPSVQLAAKGGEIPPISWNTTGDPQLEKAAFSLRPGEVSQIVGTPQGLVVLKCDARIPPDPSKKLETERPALEKEIIEKKLQYEAIPKMFETLQKQASPKLFLQKYRSEEEWLRDIQQEIPPELLQQAATPATAPPAR